MQKNLKILLFLGIAVAAFASCKKDTETVTVNNPVFELTGNASGSQEAPNKVTTAATGTLSGSYNKDTNIMTYKIDWTGLSGNATAMHFHGPADPGAGAGVQIAIPGFPTTPSGTVSGTTVALTDDQEKDLMNGRWYYNIHTAANPGGEIRGQVVLKQ